MKKLLIAIMLFVNIVVHAQNKVLHYMQELHHSMVMQSNTSAISKYIYDSLSYGHSNGWIETKTNFIKNLSTGYIKYHSIKEDSVQVVQEGNTAYIRFIADIDVTLNQKRATYHLKVLEVWIQKKNRWVLMVRQAVKGN